MAGGEALSRFLEDCRRRALSSNTVDHRRRVLGAFERWAELAVLNAQTDDIATWLSTRPLTAASLNSYLSAFAAFYCWAERAGLRDDDPSRSIPRPRIPRRLPRPVADDDLAFALRVAGEPMGAWLALAAFEGMRAAEIAHICREHVFESREPPVVLVHQGKGRKDRIVPLHPQALEHLHAAGLPSRGPLFRREDGGPWPPGAISSHVSRFLRGLGVDATAHRFRHWLGSGVYRESKDLRLTQELLGHDDPKTTAAYAAWDQAEAATVVRRLGRTP